MQIKRVAVLGSGVMGSAIAAHLANAGIPSLLFDLRDKSGKPLAKAGLEAAIKSKPAAFYLPADAALVAPCVYEDDAEKLATCDWIVEVVVERLDVKRKIFEWVAKHRREGSIVSSNTSGIRLADMVAAMPEEMRERFLITHFFNPVRYMRLLELVAGPDTLPAVTAAMAEFGDRVLGKGVVFAKDTPNFIANRIGTYGMASVFRHMEESGLTIEQVDAIFGPAVGRPSSAVFRTADLVGLDTLGHVFANLREGLPDDEEREIFTLPPAVTQLIAKGALGEKSGAGFYKKVKSADGKSEILVLDLATLEYRPQEKVRFDAIGKAKRTDDLGEKLRAMVYAEDPAGIAAWTCTADTLLYAARRIPEIADDIVNVDRAMRWGFGWELGPFETWDAIGLRRSVDRMRAEGREIPAWVEAVLASGAESFYTRDTLGRPRFVQTSGEPRVVAEPDGVIRLADAKAVEQRVISRNTSASLVDLGDGVLCLEFHSKMNAIDELILDQYEKALDKIDNLEYEALVVGNQDPRAFCAGANLLMILMGAMQQQWAQIDAQLARLQNLMMRAKYNARPVVTAPHGLTLGGGVEIAMHSSATVCAAEAYVGLVEVGVGLIPGAGGCKELLVRYLGDVPQDIDYDPNPFVQRAFERIGLAKVSSSAEEARAWGYLRPTDRVTLNPDRVIADAKALAIGLSRSYVPPRRRTVRLPGPTGRAAIELFLYQMHQGGHATDHDVTVGKKLAYVLTGGDIPWGTVRTEQDLLDLEREAFLSLAGDPKTQARIQTMLQTGKPLRN